MSVFVHLVAAVAASDAPRLYTISAPQHSRCRPPAPAADAPQSGNLVFDAGQRLVMTKAGIYAGIPATTR